ncbi:UDP kinase [Loigolactobacillus bifermentans]|nr:diacylglycerol kinase family protein [Loigolactobacillus bifermentans]QGG61782.1 UDP kinase [Loigolactobacillus bifermentans]
MGLNGKQTQKNRHFGQSLRHAVQGLRAVLQAERNFRFHLLASLLVIAAGIWVTLSRWEWLALCIAIFGVLQSELLNTVVESLVDLLTVKHYMVAAKYAKDVAAGAVLVAAVFALVVGLLIFGPHFIDWIKR